MGYLIYVVEVTFTVKGRKMKKVEISKYSPISTVMKVLSMPYYIFQPVALTVSEPNVLRFFCERIIIIIIIIGKRHRPS